MRKAGGWLLLPNHETLRSISIVPRAKRMSERRTVFDYGHECTENLPPVVFHDSLAPAVGFYKHTHLFSIRLSCRLSGAAS